MRQTLNLTEGPPLRLMLSFALPMLVSQLFQQLYTTADAFIVSRFLGTGALAAVSSSGTLIFLFTSFFFGVSMGSGVVISRYFGAGDARNVSRAIHTNLAFGLTTGLLMTVTGVLLTPVLLRWMNTDPAILPLAEEYFRYYFTGMLAMVLYNTCSGILTALGDSRRPLLYLILASVLNIGLDLLFLGVFGWSVWSAAVATVLSQLTSFLLCLAHLLQKDQVFTVKLRRIRFHMDILREILRFGLPSGVQHSVIGLANVIVQSQINTFGAFATAGYGAYIKIEGFALLSVLSFNNATTTFISQNLGARRYDRARIGARNGILLAVGAAELFGALIYVFAPQLIGLFDSGERVLRYGVLQARTIALWYCLVAFSHSVAAICRGSGLARVPMIVMLLSWCVFRVAFIFLMMRLSGEVLYVYLAYPLSWAVSSAVFAVYLAKSDWVHGFERGRRQTL